MEVDLERAFMGRMLRGMLSAECEEVRGGRLHGLLDSRFNEIWEGNGIGYRHWYRHNGSQV
jgi:hypothetical protein